MGGYGLLGRKLGHSFSPRIHAMLGSYPYRLIELEQEALPGFLEANDLDGFNVTIPYKRAVIPYLSGLSDTARAIGSVNTVLRRADGSLFGDNTDAWGFGRLLGDASAFAGSKALVLGSGGSAGTVTAVLKEAGIMPVVISRSGEDHYGNLERHTDARLIVNTTPLGMYPSCGEQALSLRGFPCCRLVIDLIYNPQRTALLLEAEALGMEARNGLLMLSAQAARAAELWGLVPEGEDRSADIAERLAASMRSLALIGMPGCGKSEVARALGRLSGRRVFDTDEMIERSCGRTAAELIAELGIEAFRQMETEALTVAGREPGVIIATGGGAVCEERNLPLLRQNSRIVWLQRDLDSLSLLGRPLSLQKGVEALYRERAPLYESWSELSMRNDGVEQTAKRIAEEMLP